MDLDAGLREAARVLRPGARLVILEFTVPLRQPLRGLYFAYFRHLLPLIGRFVSKHRDAYDWLPASVLAFPGAEELGERMGDAGFDAVRYDLLFGGVCSIHVGERASTVNGQRSTGSATARFPGSLAPRLPGSLT
jgi:demethylmenaquinone methyltransferase/2-methoxy-6-polyprenyl-1,4-benzoquinol methylase